MNRVLQIVDISRTLNNETNLLPDLNCELFTAFSTFHVLYRGGRLISLKNKLRD
jgi:hypothetical protein